MAGGSATSYHINHEETMIKALNRDAAKATFDFGPMLIEATQDHILPSSCHHEATSSCQVCRFREELKLPCVPDMIFPNNSISIFNRSGIQIISFITLDALKMVETQGCHNLEVAPSKVWREARGLRSEVINEGFDWTYTSNYQGSVDSSRVTYTDEKINIEMLKRRDPIRFYKHVILYEDELSDHGCARMTIRIRVMPTCFLLLCRFYLRVDEVLVRICDTRLFGELESNYLLRDWTRREAKYEELSSNCSKRVFVEDEIWEHLPILMSESSKISLE